MRRTASMYFFCASSLLPVSSTAMAASSSWLAAWADCASSRALDSCGWVGGVGGHGA
jgi:hypothetical protein